MKRRKKTGQEAAEMEEAAPGLAWVLRWLVVPVVVAVAAWVGTRLAGLGVPLVAVPAAAAGLVAAGLVVATVQARWPGRWLLIPIGGAAAVWIAAAVAPLSAPASLIPAGLLVAAGVIGTVIAVRRLLVQRSLPPRRRQGSRRAVFALVAITAGLVWMLLAVVTSAASAPMLASWAGMTVVAVVLWSRTGWVRHRVRADHDVRAWPELSAKLDIAGSILTAIVWTRAGRSLHVQLPEGRTWRQIRPDHADSVLGVAPGAVTVERDLTSARHVTIHVQDTDPWSGGPIPHPIEQHLEALEATRVKVRETRLPTVEDLPNWVEDPALIAPWLPASATVTDPLPIGERATGDPAGMPVYKPNLGAVHWLVGGQTGGGKSVLLRDILTGLFRCRDVVVWGIDTAKSGKAFGPWSEHMRVARTLAEAEALLADARGWIKNSAAASAAEAQQGQGADNVEPSTDRPMLVVLIDEAADVFDTTSVTSDEDADLKYGCVEHAEAIGATGRSEAVAMVVMAQRPDGTVIPARLRTHFRGGIGLKTKTESELQYVLQGEAADDLDPSIFRHEGLLFLQDDADVVPAPIRSYGLTKPEVCARIAAVLGAGLPQAPDWLLPTTTAKDTNTGDTGEQSHTTDTTEATETTETTQNTETAMTPRKKGRTGRAESELRNLRSAVEETRAELDADLEAEDGIEVPNIDLSEIAQHHQPEPEHINPTDRKAAQTLLNVLTAAGDDGLTRANVANHADLDELTTQRLLGTLERLGHVTGDDGVGPTVRWRIVPTTTPNGHHDTSSPTTNAKDGEA